MIRTKKQELAYLEWHFNIIEDKYHDRLDLLGGDPDTASNDIEWCILAAQYDMYFNLIEEVSNSDEYLVTIDGEEFGVYTSIDKAHQAIIENFDGDSVFKYADVCIYKL